MKEYRDPERMLELVDNRRKEEKEMEFTREEMELRNRSIDTIIQCAETNSKIIHTIIDLCITSSADPIELVEFKESIVRAILEILREDIIPR